MMENMKGDILQAIQGNKTKQNESSDVMAPLNSTLIRQITDQLRPKRKPKVYVFGESHIHRKNDCDLQDTIPSLNVELAEYVSVGGGIYNDISDRACQALRKQDFGDHNGVERCTMVSRQEVQKNGNRQLTDEVHGRTWRKFFELPELAKECCS